MAFFVDNFTGTSGTDLSSHTPDTGTSWTLLWQAATNNFDIKTNNLGGEANSTSDGFIYTADVTYPSANYNVTFTLVGLSATAESPVYVFVRIQDVENMYAVYLRVGTNLCRLYKKVSGTWTALGSAFDEPAAGSVCKLEIIGNVLKFYDDGVEVASATDSSISAAGKAGIGAGGGAELVTSTDDVRTTAVLDTLSITEVSTVLVIQNADSSHSSDNLALIQHNILSTQDSSHAHSSDNLTLVSGGTALVIQNSDHLHSSDVLVLVQHNVLVLQNSDHVHTSDNLSLIQHHILGIQDASHVHTSDTITLTIPIILSIQNSMHDSESNNIHFHDDDHVCCSPRVLLLYMKSSTRPRR